MTTVKIKANPQIAVGDGLHNSFYKGKKGELTYNEETGELHVHDGVTYGGRLLKIHDVRQEVSDGTVDVSLGNNVTINLSGDSIFSLVNLEDGMSVTIHIVGGDVHQFDWSGVDIQWHGNIPVLGSTHTVLLERSGEVIYGYDSGSVVV